MNFKRNSKRGFIIFGIGALCFFGGCTKSSQNLNEKVIQLVSEQKLKGLDPAYTLDAYESRQIGMTYETLYQYHYLKRPYEVIPQLADGMPKVSNDGKTYTIQIKKGILFQDDDSFKETKGKGREVTAQDFVYSFKRVADPKSLSNGWWIFDGKILGLNEWRESVKQGESPNYDTEVEGIKALDRYTLQVKLKAPSYQFIYFLTMAYTAVVAREAVAYYGVDFSRTPVGTGPFILDRKESNVNSKLIWVKNPNFRNETYPSDGTPEDAEKGLLKDAGKQLPLVDKVIYHIQAEENPRWLNFMSGEIDVAKLPKDNFSQAISNGELKEELKQKGVSLHKQNAIDVTYTAFNMDDPIIGKNKLLRQALSLAWDVGPFIQLFYNGQAIPAQGPVPPGVFGYNAEFVNRYAKFNLDKAKELLAKAGYPEGKGLPTIQFVGRTDTGSRQMNDYLVKSFEKIGVKLNVKAFNWPEFVSNMNNKNGQMWSISWLGDYPDPESFLQLFYGKNVSPGPNNANFRNSEFDMLYEKHLEMGNTPEKQKIINKMVSIIEEECPWIFGAHRVNYMLTQPWVKNYKNHDFEEYSARYYSVDLDVKKQKN